MLRIRLGKIKRGIKVSEQIKQQRIVILGGGVIGLAIALELGLRKHQVTVIEKGQCGGQATGAAAGMLAPYSEIGEDPDDFFTMCHESLLLYPKWQAIVKEISAQDFEYNTSGSLHAVFHEADELALETRLQWQKGWGVHSEIIKGAALRNLEPHLTEDVIAAMYYPSEHHVYAPDYVGALKHACLRLGVQVVENAGDVAFQELRKDGVLLHCSQAGLFSAETCIIATGAWTAEHEQALHIRLPIFPIRGQICAFEQGPEKVQHMVFSSQGYVVAKKVGSIVCGASEDVAGFDTSVTEKGIKRLLKWGHKLFPFTAQLKPFHQWAGLRPATQDGFPLIGRVAHQPNIIISSGHYRNGILLSPRNAKLVADLYEEKELGLDTRLFDPMRFS